MTRTHVARCLALAMLLLAATFAAAQTSSDTGSTGRRVDFPITQFRDTLFTAVDGVFRVRADPDGHLWYTTEGGVVHVDPYNETRELFTKFEGLPSSYTLGLDAEGARVYVGTDLGLGIIDRRTGAVEAYHPGNSPVQDNIIFDVALIGDELWVGTRFMGVGIWDTTRPITDEASWTWKNTSTTPDYAQGVRRITATPTAVWLATEGDGAWRYDRASKTWNVTVYDDGLPDTTVLSVAERAGTVWFGTPRGLASRDASGAWTYYNRTLIPQMPSERIIDLDVLPTTSGTTEIFASTSRGVWQLNPETGYNITLAQSYGILGSYIFDNEPAQRGWAFATSRGVSYFLDGTWRYYATGPSSGPSWGPLSFGFTSASVGEQNGYLWFGSGRGISAYRLPSGGDPGYWQNFGEWQNFPGSVVNWIDTERGVTWVGTNSGTFGFEHETGRWIPKISQNSRNLVYALEADGEELWIALFGDGLISENLTTGVVRTWTYENVASPIPDQYLTDVRADGGTIWLGSSVGVIRMDRVTGTFTETYDRSDGLPGSGVVYRLLPEGPTVWVGTKDGGVAKLDVQSGKVGRVWNATNDPGFPGGEMRALYREGGRLWVGTTEGLARVDVTTGQFRAWRQADSGLIQDYVNGISSADGILYIATLSGVQRMHIASGEFLPLRDGPGVVRGEGGTDAATGGGTRVNVRIDAPRDGTAVTGVTQVRGSALVFGAAVDRVEVRIGDGPWQVAEGTETWSFDWDTSSLTPSEPVTVSARAFAGELTGETEILVTPIAPPKVPLAIEEIAPTQAYAGRPLKFGARVEGDEPLSASLYYKPAGAAGFTRLQLTRTGNLFFGTVPARDVQEGELRYFLEAESNGLIATAAGDALDPTLITVAPAPRLAVAVDAPPLVTATAGEDTTFTLNVTNAGTEPAVFRVSASGLRAAWIHVPAEDLELGPGETQPVVATMSVPAAAFADNTTVTFEARDASGVADPAQASVPVRILAAQAQPTPTPTGTAPRGIPGFEPILALAAALAIGFSRRRSS